MPERPYVLDFQPPIFVVGYMHSGTTMLRNILSLHPQVHGIGTETRLFEHLSRLSTIVSHYREGWQEKLVDTMISLFEAGKNRSDIDHLEVTRSTFVAFLESMDLCEKVIPDGVVVTLFGRMAEELAGTNGKHVWLEKTPSHIFYLDDIFRFFPKARVVEIVRDPRDIVASKKTRTQTVGPDRYRPDEIPFKKLEKDFDPVLDTLSWRSAEKAGRSGMQRFGEERVCRVSYETLVTHPEETLKRVCAFLNLHYSDAMLYPEGRIPADMNVPKAGIRADSIGRWVKTLTPSEISIIELLARPAMKELHLSTSNMCSFKRILAFPLLLKGLWGLFRRLYKRLKMGGTTFFLKTLKGYLRRLRALMLH